MMLVTNPLEEAAWFFPLMECLHILGLAVSIGTIAIVDFALLGAGPARENAGNLARGLAPWTLAGLVDMLFTGPMLYLANGGADEYWYNPGFRFKMVCLALAITYQYTVHRKAANPDLSGSQGKWIAAISLVLWIGVIAGGLFIAFTGG